MARQPIEPKKVFELSIISFVILEALSFLLDKLGLMSFIKAGWIIFMFLLVIILTMLFNLGINLSQIRTKEIVLSLIVLLLTISVYFFIPLVLPQIFSIIPGNEIRSQLVQTLGSVAGIGTGII
ncbi:MAG: hypothetical protein WC758_07780 [Candidatus Woesearchaeota archaeon]|jgi:hypothetical protein